MTFTQLYTDYITNKAPLLKRGTIRNYDICYRLYLSPTMGAIPLNEITTDFIVKTFEGWRKQYTPSITQNIKKHLCSICNYGIEIKAWQVNPVSGIKIKRQMPNVKALQIEQIKQLLQGCINSPYYLEVLLLALTGMRSAELRGLQWQDIDVDKNTIRICRTYDLGRISTTKTDLSQRTIDLDSTVIKALLSNKKDGTWVFVGHRGKPISSSSTLRAHFKACLITAGLQYVHVHSMRHTHATYLLESGVSLKAIQQRMGWSTATVLLMHYAHISKKERQKVIDLIGRLVDNT